MKKYRNIWDIADTAILFSAIVPATIFVTTSNQTAREWFMWMISIFAASKFMGWVVDSMVRAAKP